MSHERTYFLIETSSPVLDVVEEALQQQKTFRVAMRELKAKHCATGVWTWEQSRFCGLVFNGDPPDGWRFLPSKNYCCPDSRTRAGKLIRKEVESLPTGVTPATFSEMLCAKLNLDFTYWANNSVSWTVYERYGDSLILSVPTGCALNEIPGGRELKMSEYWALREAIPEAANA